MGAAPGLARSIPRGFGEIPPHVAPLQSGETEGTKFAAQEPVLHPSALSLLPSDLVRGCLADFLIHHSSFSPLTALWILPHRLHLAYFTLTLFGFRKSCPTVSVLDELHGEGIQCVPTLWPPCPTLPPIASPSSPLCVGLCLFFLWFSVNPSKHQMSLSDQGWKYQQQAARAYSILCFLFCDPQVLTGTWCSNGIT